jgi:hypothetical protein
MESTEVYQIKVCGRLDARWSDWFGEMAITYQVARNGLPATAITGAVVDQAALYGILWKLRDLNLKLISVTLVEADSTCKGPAQHERGNTNG